MIAAPNRSVSYPAIVSEGTNGLVASEQSALNELDAAFNQPDMIAVLVRLRQFCNLAIRKQPYESNDLKFYGQGNEG